MAGKLQWTVGVTVNNSNNMRQEPEERLMLLLEGDFASQRVDVRRLATELNWNVLQGGPGEPLPKDIDPCEVSAVICELPGGDCGPIEEARYRFPNALIVACTRFSCSLAWDRMNDSGAFHMLQMPFREGEVRLSLGFLRSALAAPKRERHMVVSIDRAPAPFPRLANARRRSQTA
jgi:hypothetical protein